VQEACKKSRQKAAHEQFQVSSGGAKRDELAGCFRVLALKSDEAIEGARVWVWPHEERMGLVDGELDRIRTRAQRTQHTPVRL